MRDFEKKLIPNAERILWLCVALERFLGTNSFAHVRMLHSGMPSVMTAPAIRKAAQALFNLRLMKLGIDTPTGVKSAIDDYLNHHHSARTEGEYEIDPNAQTFQRRPLISTPRLNRLEEVLGTTAAYEVYDIPTATADDELIAISADKRTIPLHQIDVGLPPPGMHAQDRHPRGPIDVPIIELLTIAEEMDAREKERDVARAGSWHDRLSAVVVQQCAVDTLQETDHLTLCECRHLLGLPGVGKTSLLMVLAVWLSRHGYRTMMVFPTIEVSSQYMESLRVQDVEVALLSGESNNTRYRHYKRNGETIASQYGHGGFGGSLPTGEDFAANCVLQAFSRSPFSDWQYGHAPCEEIKVVREKGDPQPILCPLFAGCGRRKATRDRVTALVWVGHIASMDTRVPAYTSEMRMRYFEYIAKSFDVVIFDEADAIQADLDSQAAYKLEIMGTNSGLVPEKVSKIQHRVTGHDSHTLGNSHVQSFGRTANAVSQLTYIVGGTLNDMNRNSDQIQAAKYFDRQLLTSAKMIIDILGGMRTKSVAEGDRDDVESREKKIERVLRSNAIIELWDEVTYEAFTDRVETTDGVWSRAAYIAGVMGKTEAETLKITAQLRRHLVRFQSASPIKTQDELDAITRIMKRLCFDDSFVEPRVEAGLMLLTPITLMIIGYRRLVTAIKNLPLDPDLIDLKDNMVSPELQRYIPESLVGALSGLKYQMHQSDDGRDSHFKIQMEHVTIKGSPRLYLHNFHRLFKAEGQRVGPAVLLVSATSFIQDSPSFHIHCGPHYVLQRKKSAAPKPMSEWQFLPQLDDRPGVLGVKYLNFSGAGDRRMDNLKQMVLKLLKGEMATSQIYRDMRRHDVVGGIGRKAALIVNSYDQARFVKEVIDENFPDLRQRTKAVVSAASKEEINSGRYVSTAAVESIGDDDECDILIFPIGALQRGVNVVHTHGPRSGEAALGHLYFLTRPHPSSDDMQFLLGLIGQQAQQFSTIEFGRSKSIDDISDAYEDARRQQFKDVWQVLRDPVMASRMTMKMYRQFVANQIVPLFQTIGRGTRGGCKVWVYFVDAAWAPRSALGDDDDAKSSMLVMMREILEEYVRHGNSLHREIYQALYHDYLTPMRAIKRLQTKERAEDDDFDESDYFDFDQDVGNE
ncbi:hypothetical protein KTQ42_22765 [Noviherbaspirillum sp. L7-7A]|uniref:pPIWI_RE_Z domain-containing protein n=1 Tax=Noviherbaspirillum sp. L7-7A TaxID=2850560 RepID=UPI001C2BA8C3|nr:hypothetical protein [Noviherbaspirillum sp. L7-7A]MBV0882103.1 hypothetical protein [Noviherbaspirillum sp. L7-7A]